MGLHFGYCQEVAKYATNEFTLDLPEQFDDRTVNIFALTDYGPSDFGVVINRVSAPANVPLPVQVSTLLRELETQLSSFQLHDRTQRLVDGLEAEEIRYSFSKNGFSLLQRQVALHLPEVRQGRHLTLTITATFNENAPEHWHEDFEALLESVRFLDR